MAHENSQSSNMMNVAQEKTYLNEQSELANGDDSIPNFINLDHYICPITLGNKFYLLNKC
jgi:hypothetical protein